MRPHVHLELTAARRRVIITLFLAFERPLTCVRQHVPRDVSALRRRVVTALLLAFERPLTRVHSHVLLEEAASRRRIVTALFVAFKNPRALFRRLRPRRRHQATLTLARTCTRTCSASGCLPLSTLSPRHRNPPHPPPPPSPPPPPPPPPPRHCLNSMCLHMLCENIPVTRHKATLLRFANINQHLRRLR